MSEQEQNPRRRVDFEDHPIIQKIEELKYINEAKRPDDFPMNEYRLEDFPEIELRPIEDEFDFGRRRIMPSFGEPARYTRWPKIGFDLEKLKLMPDVLDASMQEGHNHEAPAINFDPVQAAAFSAWLKEYLAEHPLEMDPSIFKGLPIKREPNQTEEQIETE